MTNIYATDNKHKSYAIIALCCQIILLIGSLIYYKERMLFSDAPHVLFKIINENKLQIAENRYGSFITQLFPLIGARMHLSLSALTLLYSASFNLFFLGTSALLTFKYKRYDLTLLLTFYLTLFVSDTYFWTNNEVHQGITWLMIAFAVSNYMKQKERPKIVVAAVFILLAALAIWTHPLVMLAALFLWFFYLIDKGNKYFSKGELIIYSVVLLGLSFMKFYQGMHHGYDSGKIEFVTQLKADGLKTILSAPQLHSFVKHCITNYWLVLLLSAAGLMSLIKEKKYLLAACTLVASCGYILLICVTYREVKDWLFYMESEYMPLSIICCAPFVYYTLPTLKKQFTLVLLTLVFSIRLGYIQHSSKLFTDRVATLHQIKVQMKKHGLTKAIVTQSENANQQLIMNWGTPVESIVLSKLDGEVPQRTFICADSGMLKGFNTTSKDTLLGCFEKVPASSINGGYFVMDTTSVYSTLTYGELMR